MVVTSTRPADEPPARAAPQVDGVAIEAAVGGIRHRWPSIGLAVGVVRGGRLERFEGAGLADIGSRRPITEDTIFRVASITKLFTAVAVMQLWERGLIDLDAPANDYLRAYRLMPASATFRPATVRHLLTHTAGIPDVLHAADLLHPGWGRFEDRPAALSVEVGEALPTLAEVYRGGLPVVVEPGITFAYSNHGFATLGQLIEDVTGKPLDGYLRDHIFGPLGMTDTGLDRSRLAESRLATGYDLGPSGAQAVPDREWVTRGASGISSTARDMARFIAALLGGGANEHGSVLRTATLSTMFAPHHQPDPRLPGIGLGFFHEELGGHRMVGHDGRLPGFHSQLLLAPDDGVGVIGLTNGSSGAISWMPIELRRLLGDLIGASEEPIRTDLPHHPEVWGEIVGRYQLPPRVSDLRGRLMMGGGAEVFVRAGRPMVRVRTPLPSLYRGLPLQPDDEHDPYAFRLDLSRFGMPLVRVLFSRDGGSRATAIHTDLGMMSFDRRPATKGLRGRAWGAIAFVTAVMAMRRLRRSGEAHAD